MTTHQSDLLVVGLSRFALIAVALYAATQLGLLGIAAGAAVLTLLTPPVRR